MFSKNAKAADKFRTNENAPGKSADKFEGANTKGKGKAADKFEHTAEGGCKLVQSEDGQSLVQADPTCTAADHYKSDNANNAGKKSADYATGITGQSDNVIQFGKSADKFSNATGNRNGVSADGFNRAEGKGKGKSADNFAGAEGKKDGKAADTFEHTNEGGCRLVQVGNQLVQADPNCKP